MNSSLNNDLYIRLRRNEFPSQRNYCSLHGSTLNDLLLLMYCLNQTLERRYYVNFRVFLSLTLI
jgi:NRPS condensation-like uncharacterized protein